MKQFLSITLAAASAALIACSSEDNASTSSTSASSSSSTSTSTSTSSSSAAASSSGDPGMDAGPDVVDTGTGSIVRVVGRQLLVQRRNTDGTLAPEEPYDMKGIAWSPFGANEPFDGSGKIYSTHAIQDLNLMKAANINTPRTYGPFERNADGIAVLDALYERGMMVAMTVFAGYDDSAYTEAVQMFKDHPAILLWIVGNEWNYNKLYSNHSFDECAGRVSQVAGEIKAIDPNHPVAIGYGELPSANDLAKVTVVDLWALNIYPYLDFADRWTKWTALTEKPFFVSEYGADAFNQGIDAEDQNGQKTAIEALTGQIRAHLSAVKASEPCVGGCPFEWNDEWWKGGNPAAHDKGGFANGGVYPDGQANEEWWGIVTADRAPRAAYTSLQNLYK